MNSAFGHFSDGGDPTYGRPPQQTYFDYLVFLKQTDCPKPAKTWLIVDEHPDSINDGYFVNNPTGVPNWQDVVASYHNGACGFSFADGHSEIKKWRSSTSMYPGKYTDGVIPKTFDALGALDFAWYLERTGLVTLRGQPSFGY